MGVNSPVTGYELSCFGMRYSPDEITIFYIAIFYIAYVVSVALMVQ